MTPTLDELNKLRERKLVNCQGHPTAPLTIWNYTNFTQYGRHWSDATIAARGLILDNAGSVVARGFRKFWNFGERKEDAIPDCPCKVLNKADGSLGILFFIDGHPSIATRGSFTGEQATVGTEIFCEKYAGYKPPEGFTAVFEVIYPENKIVVDYGDRKDLVHLGLVDNATGLVHFDLDPNWPGPCVQEFELGAPEELIGRIRPNAEGYVIRWQNGFQLKVKLEEYLRVHRAMFCTSTRSIWEQLSAGEGLEQILESMPDEVYQFTKEQGEKLLFRFWDILNEARCKFDELACLRDDRKAFAAKATAWAYPAILFAMLDGKDCGKIVWKLIEPEWAPARALPGEDVA